LLERIGVARAEVRDWENLPTNPMREQLLSETLRPAPPRMLGVRWLVRQEILHRDWKASLLSSPTILLKRP